MEDDYIFNIDDINITAEPVEILSPPEESKEIQEPAPEPVAVTIPEQVETSEDSPSSEANSSHQSTLYALAKYLKDEGVLLVDEFKDVETIEELKTLIQKSHEQAKYSNLNDSQKRYFEALETGIPIKEYENLEKEISTFKNITEESIKDNQQLRYELLAIDFMNQGIEHSKALKLAELAVKDESSLQDAKDALTNILEFKSNKYKELITTKKEKTELELNDIKKAIDGKQKVLDMPINDITKRKLFDLMTTKVANDDNGLPLNKLQKFQRENPIEASILMNYLFLMTNEGKDLGLIRTSTTSTAAKELEKKLKQMNFDATGSLIIPDEMIGIRNKNENLTINI